MVHFGNAPSTRITTELIRILNHPVRREALRLLHQAPQGQMSGTQMSRVMTESVQTVNNHLRILHEAGAIDLCYTLLVRNVKENRYESLVSTIPTVIAVLAETDTEDALIRRG